MTLGLWTISPVLPYRQREREREAISLYTHSEYTCRDIYYLFSAKTFCMLTYTDTFIYIYVLLLSRYSHSQSGSAQVRHTHKPQPRTVVSLEQ